VFGIQRQFKLELKPDVKTYHAKPYPVPFSKEKKLRDELDRFTAWKSLRKVNRSEWRAPMFTISKPDGSLRSLADLRELNKRIKRKPFPIPKIQDMLHKLRGFQWVTTIDLNMGYHNILLDSHSSKLCTIVLPWGKYEYLRLPMGLCNAPDIFQEKMAELKQDFEFCGTYIDDVLILSNGSFEGSFIESRTSFRKIRDNSPQKSISTSLHFADKNVNILVIE
jgi:Reverse transcriptase (RNA-dependent DNA polymerase)